MEKEDYSSMNNRVLVLCAVNKFKMAVAYRFSFFFFLFWSFYFIELFCSKILVSSFASCPASTFNLSRSLLEMGNDGEKVLQITRLVSAV